MGKPKGRGGSGGYGGSGGAIVNTNGDATLNHVAVRDNRGGDAGTFGQGGSGSTAGDVGAPGQMGTVGGVRTLGTFGGYVPVFANLTISHSTFERNIGGITGAVQNYAAYDSQLSLTISDSVFRENRSNLQAGGVSVLNRNSRNQAIIRNSLFERNHGGTGGGIYSGRPLNELYSPYGSSVLRIVNTTLSGNLAEYGGAVAVTRPGVFMTNSTITGNAASVAGGGIHSASPINLKNTLVPRPASDTSPEPKLA